MITELETSIISGLPRDPEIELVKVIRSQEETGALAHYQSPFSEETDRRLINYVIGNQVGIGPIGKSELGNPIGYNYMFNLKIALLAMSCCDIPVDVRGILKDATLYDRPDFQLTRDGLGFFARIDQKKRELFNTNDPFLSPKALVPLLMGKSWEQVDISQKMDYWEPSKKNPQVMDNFLANHSIIGLTIPIVIPLEVDEIKKVKPDEKLLNLLVLIHNKYKPKDIGESQIPFKMEKWRFEYLFDLLWGCYWEIALEAFSSGVKEDDLLSFQHTQEVLSVAVEKFKAKATETTRYLTIAISYPEETV